MQITETIQESANNREIRGQEPGGQVCLLCGSRLELVVDELTDTRFGNRELYGDYRCQHCGLEQTLPRPTLAKLKELYESQYNFGGEADTLYTRLRERFIFSWLYRHWTALDGDISFHLRRGSGRLLDVGCNEGRGLRIYRQNGFNVEGLELNERAAAAAQAFGFSVHTCLLHDLRPPMPYDVVVLSNVLEHTLDPREMLVDVCRILRPGGQVWISCPNAASWQRWVFGRSWINWHVPFHITHFSEESLRSLLGETGFPLAKVRQISPALWAAHSVVATAAARRGQKNKHLRNPFITASLMLLLRGIGFPLLWFFNLLGRGDCLLVTARKS